MIGSRCHHFLRVALSDNMIVRTEQLKNGKVSLTKVT